MKYVNPVNQVHQDYLENAKNEVSTSILHSKEQKIKINIRSNQY